ncbi:type IV pilus modification PilV family protein [Blastopirellula retiformator]|nr:hypothetical protein [Blastopirellula retiformator]
MNTKQPTRTRRGGITLVEVLMSTMVVMLGILGLISLIPLGSHLAERGTRSDRVASIGRRVYRDAVIRGILNPDTWLDLGKTAPVDQTRLRAGANPLPVRQSYLIDPMFFVDNATQRQAFPYVGGTPQMRRLSLGAYNTDYDFVASRAERAFVSDDDFGVADAIGYVRPDDREFPLEALFFRRDLDGDGNQTAADNIRRQSAGTYSWAIMLTPEPSSTPVNVTSGGNRPPFALAADASQPATDIYNMSTIIFQDRQGKIPLTTEIAASLNERVLAVGSGFISGGSTAGEVVVQGTVNELEMQTGDWICLSARLETTSGGNTYYWGDVFKWYRILAMDEIDATGTPFRRLTISGPDWNVAQAPDQAIYMEGVVGVYERKVRLETGSPWTP